MKLVSASYLALSSCGINGGGESSGAEIAHHQHPNEAQCNQQ